MQGENYQVDKEPLLSIPIKCPTNVTPFEALARAIIEGKTEERDTAEEEAKLDKMFFALYKVSKEEEALIMQSIPS